MRIIMVMAYIYLITFNRFCMFHSRFLSLLWPTFDLLSYPRLKKNRIVHVKKHILQLMTIQLMIDVEYLNIVRYLNIDCIEHSRMQS